MKRGPSISQAQSLHHAMKDLEAQDAIEALQAQSHGHVNRQGDRHEH